MYAASATIGFKNVYICKYIFIYIYISATSEVHNTTGREYLPGYVQWLRTSVLKYRVYSSS